MSIDDDKPADGILKARLTRYLPAHMVTFGAAATFAALSQIIAPVSFSLLKPILIWAIFLIAHFLYVRAVNTEQAWADERSSTIMLNATDLSHIDDIRQRYEAKQRQTTEVEDDDAPSR